MSFSLAFFLLITSASVAAQAEEPPCKTFALDEPVTLSGRLEFVVLNRKLSVARTRRNQKWEEFYLALDHPICTPGYDAGDILQAQYLRIFPWQPDTLFKAVDGQRVELTGTLTLLAEHGGFVPSLDVTGVRISRPG